jgi:hypothetical protein
MDNDELEYQYETLKLQNSELKYEIIQLKKLISSFSKNNGDDHYIDNPTKNYNNYNAALVNIGQNVGQALAKGEKSDYYQAAFSLTSNLLGQHKKELLTGFSNIFSSFFSGTRSHGGYVNHNQSYLVGEHGAEVFTPTTNGNITRRVYKKNQNIQQNKKSFSKFNQQILDKLF